MKHLFFILFIFFGLTVQAQETSFICAGATKILTANATGGTAPITYTWTSPSAVVTTGATVTANATGTYTWTATDVNGCTAAGTHDITIEANPTVTLNAVGSCVGSAQTISATGVPAGYTYAWNFGSGATPATATSPTASVSYSTSGTKTITLDITRIQTGSANGCSATCVWTKTTTVVIGTLTGGSSCN